MQKARLRGRVKERKNEENRGVTVTDEPLSERPVTVLIKTLFSDLCLSARKLGIK